MALINCPECKKEISDQATICPHCGYPIKKELNDEIKKFSTETSYKGTSNMVMLNSNKKLLYIAIGVFIVLERFFKSSITQGLGYSLIPCLLLFLPLKGKVKMNGTIVIGIIVLAAHIGAFLDDNDLSIAIMLLSCTAYVFALYFAKDCASDN